MTITIDLTKATPVYRKLVKIARNQWEYKWFIGFAPAQPCTRVYPSRMTQRTQNTPPRPNVEAERSYRARNWPDDDSGQMDWKERRRYGVAGTR